MKNLLLGFLLFLVLVEGKLKLGDGCRLGGGKLGICKKYADCPAAQKDAAKQKWPKVCLHSGYTTIVCCDEGQSSLSATTSTTTTTTTTPKPTTTDDPNVYVPGRISQRMCEKYSKWVKRLTIALGDDEDEFTSGQCGANVETFIIGGTEAGKLEFPHMAHLGFAEDVEEDDIAWDCGGSLISDNFVITAAHCLKKKTGTELTHVRLGTGDPWSTIVVKVAEKFPHPSYNVSRYYNDIALLRLERKVKFDNYRRPACLMTEKIIPNTHGTATGWGVTEKDWKGSKKLLKVDLPFISNQECSRTYKLDAINLPKGIDDATQVCAGGLNLKKDTCQGDSGGPLQVVLREPHCMYSIVGITAFGIKCGIAPGVYTRIAGYVPWIESIVWPTPNNN